MQDRLNLLPATHAHLDMRTQARRLPLRFAAATLIVSLAGCVAPPVDPQQHFRLSGAEAPTLAVLVVDDRSAAQRDLSTYPEATLVRESVLSPDAATYVAQELARIVQAHPDRARLEGLLAGKTIRLRHFEVEATRASPTPTRNPDTTPPGIAAIDFLAASLATGMNYRAQFYVDIDVDLDGGHYISHATGTMNVTPFPDALIQPAHDAVAELVDRIANGRTSIEAPAP